MNKQIKIWRLVLESLQQNSPVMLLYVLESSGSSPGRQGFFMAVNANKQMEGSIGGGIMEHKFVELAGEQLQAASYKPQGSTQSPNIEHQTSNIKPASGIRIQIHDKSA